MNGFNSDGLTDLKVSILVLFAICWICSCVRFYIRVRIQKQFSLDDAFLIFGLSCLTCAVGVLFTFLDDLYTAEAYSLEDPSFVFTLGFINQSFNYHKMVTIVLMLSWCAIGCVKLSYLFLFRRLIDRLRPMVIYWYIAVAFNLATIGYGIAVYYLACPYYYSIQACKSRDFKFCAIEIILLTTYSSE